MLDLVDKALDQVTFTIKPGVIVPRFYFYPGQYYRATGTGRRTHYYFLGDMKIAERNNFAGNPLTYYHGDQVDSTVYTNNNGTDMSRRYSAFGKTRSGAVDTNFTYTGQHEDNTGLIYMNARYYDPSSGIFISPDSIIPDPTNPMDYNRYTYARGNPVSFNDPSGYFTDEEIMQHFGVDSWEGVEAQFQQGGSHEGLWGWLHILQKANAGDEINSQLCNMSDKAYLGGIFRRSSTGTITVEGRAFMGFDDSYAHEFPQHTVLYSELQFAQFATNPDATYARYALNDVPGLVDGIFSEPYRTHIDCQHHDCLTGILDAVGTGSAAVAAGCSWVGAAPCTVAAGTVSTGMGAIGTGWTAINAFQGNSTGLDVAVGMGTTAIGTLGPNRGVAASVFQWAWDTFIAPLE